MFSQQHCRLYKILLLLTSLLFATSCQNYLVGNMYAISIYSGKIINMSYEISGNEINVSGKSLSKEYITGKVLSASQIKKHNNFITLPNNYDQSFVRLIATPSGKILDCFITQNSKRKFSKGGYGKCYTPEGDEFNLTIDSTTVAFL
ncbi:hypothetical protein OAP83_02430 [Rickettsiales bacterium]|nr:hypothetical protein [Rickettsiales bacterium]